MNSTRDFAPLNPTSQERSGCAVPASPTSRPQPSPQVTFCTDPLWCHKTLGKDPVTIHEAPAATSRVINTLLRVVHGGSLHGGTLSIAHGYPDDPYPLENPRRGRVKTCDLNITFDQPMNMKKSERLKKMEQSIRGAKNKDDWLWKDESTLVRLHREPRRKMFVPKEASYIPCDLRRFRDERETLQVFQSNERKLKDSRRLAGNNIERTNRRSEFLDWTNHVQDHTQRRYLKSRGWGVGCRR